MSYFLVRCDNIIHFSLKCFCNFSRKTIASIYFHLLVLTLNQENTLLRSDDVASPQLLLSVNTLLSTLIENVVLEVSDEILLFAKVRITWL